MSMGPGGDKLPINLGRTIHEEQDRQAAGYGGDHPMTRSRRILAAVVAFAVTVGAISLWSSGLRILAIIAFALFVPAAVIFAVKR